jgi:hypothetical protein
MKNEEAHSVFYKKLDEISQATNVSIPDQYYRTAFHTCYKCNKEMLTFRWPEDFIFGPRISNDPQRPKTIEFLDSFNASYTYWANTCPYCNSLQGEHYINDHPESLFFSHHCDGVSEHKFKSDMMKIANEYLSRLAEGSWY